MDQGEKKKGIKGIEIFSRYITNNYTKEDLKTIFEWFDSKGFNLNRRISFRKNWDNFNTENYKTNNDEYNQELMLDNLHHLINIEQSAQNKRKKKGINRITIYQVFSGFAAILILPLIILSIFLASNSGISFKNIEPAYAEIHAPENSRMKILLPDGTAVWLNHGSVIKYPREFSRKKREVKLTGEAFFDVKHDPSRSFEVITSKLNITVLGTSFNVSAYPDDPFIATTVEEGKVIVNKIDDYHRRIRTTELNPGMQSYFMKKTEHNINSRVNPEKYTGWKDGKLMLIDDPMAIVVKKLERWYNVEVEVLNKRIYDYKYTATFIHEPIEQVLKMLSIATPISYKIEPGIKQGDNTFSKMKILIK